VAFHWPWPGRPSRDEIAQLREIVAQIQEDYGDLADQVGENTERLELADALLRRRLGVPLLAARTAAAPPPRALVDAATRVTTDGAEVRLQVGDTRLVLLLDPGGGDPDRIWEWVQGVAPTLRVVPGVAS
jgi:hypothetical protein